MRDYSQTFKKKAETKARHSNMKCQTFEVKIIHSKLNKKTLQDLNILFKEAKWFKNYCIADIKNADTTADKVLVKVKDEFVENDLSILSAQMKQSLKSDVRTSLRSLKSTKNKGNKVGKLKFKSYCNEIGLKQYGVTFNIKDDKHIKLQCFNKPFYVKGLKQIKKDYEITNSKFIRKPDGYYFHITCFTPFEKEIKTNKEIGIDFGIEHNFILSNGNKYDISVPESKSVKILSKKLNKSLIRAKKLKVEDPKHTSNHYKRCNELRKAYQKDNNKKRDKANKFYHMLANEYDFIAFQDEMLQNWHKGLFGKQVQHSAMGTVKKKLKANSKAFMVERSFPSTQICPECGRMTRHPLLKRAYECQYCHYHHPDRDIKSAQSILDYAHNISFI